jgi:hypothetical protein
MRFEVLIAVSIMIMVFWDEMLYSLPDRYLRNMLPPSQGQK